MKIKYVLILTILLVCVFGCQVNSQERSNANQNYKNQNDVAPPAKSSPLKLTLNNEAMGTTENTVILSDFLIKIFKEREKEGIFREDSNEIERSVHLSADRSVPAEEIAKLFGVLRKSRANPILIPVPLKEDLIKPNPLMLAVYAGSGEPRFHGAGIEIGFIGELSENPANAPADKNSILIAASQDGTYTIDGKQISAGKLKTAIENRLKTKEKGKKVLVVRADNYGNMEDTAAIAVSAGAGKVYFITKNIRHKEKDVSFSLSPAFFRGNEEVGDLGEWGKIRSVIFEGSDYASFEITMSDKLIDKERAEAEINSEYEGRRSLEEFKVSKTEIDGASGVLTFDGSNARWLGFRKKDGKLQPVIFDFSCGREDSSYCNSEFLQIMKSIKFK